MNNNQAVISNIQRFCIHDGQGIRTIVFLKGCPLHCYWCANPENQSFKKELMHFSSKCVGCGTCAKYCPNHCIMVEEYVNIDRNLCKVCGICEKNCVSNAMHISGKVMTVNEVFQICVRDQAFFNTSNGGVTISGGEPLSFNNFSIELAKKCFENGVSFNIETCGYGDWETLKTLADYCDCVFFDVKHYDNEVHKKATGQGTDIISKNLRKLSEKTSNIVIRIPVIQHFNDSNEDITKLVSYIKVLLGYNTIKYVELLPYHRMGISKYHALDKKSVIEEFKNIDKQKLLCHIEKFEEYGIKCLIE